MTIQSFPNVPRERIDAALAAVRILGATHLVPIFKAVRDHGCAQLMIRQRSAQFEMPPLTKPVIVIVGDDTHVSMGPCGFPEASLSRLFRLCSAAAIMAGRPCIDTYLAIATAAAADRRHVVLIETMPAKEAEWKVFLRAANPKIEMIEALPARGCR